MTCANFYPLNHIEESYTRITSNSENSFFPLANLKNVLSTKLFRTQVGTTTAEVVFDFRSLKDVDAAIIQAPTVGTFGFSGAVTVEANGTNNFTSPAFTTTITPNYSLGLGITVFGSTESYRFWRVSVSTTSQYVELGNIYLGPKVTLSNNNIDFGWKYDLDDRSSMATNRYGQKYIDKINDQIKITARYRLLTTEELETLLNVFDFAGQNYPIYFEVDPGEMIISDRERFAGRFYFTARPKITNNAFRLWDTNITLEESL